MKIEDNRSPKYYVRLECVTKSEVFEYYGEIFMRLAEKVTDRFGIKANALNLRTGNVYQIDECQECIPVKSNLIVERYR